MTTSYIIMGVSGCGKTTVGKLLAEKLELPFFDGDDFHPESNICKMKNFTPLTDKDREPWLNKLTDLSLQQHTGCVIACSALKKSYRDILRRNPDIHFLHLYGDKETLKYRINQRAARENHFMPVSLLDSQLTDLEAPEDEPNTSAQEISASAEKIVSIFLEMFDDPRASLP